MRLWLLLGVLAACGAEDEGQVTPASVTPDLAVTGTNPAGGGAANNPPKRGPVLRKTLTP
jgi:hypothetical protein